MPTAIIFREKGIYFHPVCWVKIGVYSSLGKGYEGRRCECVCFIHTHMQVESQGLVSPVFMGMGDEVVEQ